jgi:hypothetical protein
MAERRFPRPDGDFAAYMNTYYDAVEKFWSVQGLDESDLTPLKDALSAWNARYPAHVAAQNAAEAARQSKDAARRELEAAARPVTAFIQAFPKTTDTDRAAIGITIRDAATRSGTAPRSRPMVVVSDAGRYTHELRLVDESSPTRRARPRGVERAEIFVAFTPAAAPAPSDMHAYRYVQSVSDGRAVLSYDSPQGGMQAHYVARWVTRRNAYGPWSETSSATVAA